MDSSVTTKMSGIGRNNAVGCGAVGFRWWDHDDSRFTDTHASRAFVEAGNELAGTEHEAGWRSTVVTRGIKDLARLREVPGVEHAGGLARLNLRTGAGHDRGDVDAVGQGGERGLTHGETLVGAAPRERSERNKRSRHGVFPEEFAGPPGWEVTVNEASLTANLLFVDIAGDNVMVCINLPWDVRFTVPRGEPAVAGARTVTLNVIGWLSVPALTASVVSVAVFLMVCANSATFGWTAQSRGDP